MKNSYSIEFEIKNPSKDLLDFIFPYRKNGKVKKELIKHLGVKFYNLSLKNKIELVKYWRKVLQEN